MTDPKRELTDTSDQMLVELAHLKATEALKRQEPISTPAFHALEDEVFESSRRIFANAVQQDRLGEESETGEVSIEDIDRERDQPPVAAVAGATTRAAASPPKAVTPV